MVRNPQGTAEFFRPSGEQGNCPRTEILRQAAATHSFDPIVITAGLVPFVGMILVLLLVRNTKATDAGLVRRI